MNKKEQNLRPHTFDDYIGQENVKELLKIATSTAKKRGDPLDHVLLYGGPGLGKTSLAQAIAIEMESNITIVTGMNIKTPSEMAAILTNLKDNDILFIDEIHNLSRKVEEVLYSAMEDGKIDVSMKIDKKLETIQIGLPHFTLIGATTRVDLLNQPFRDRFGLTLQLNFYNYDELSQIVINSANKLGILLDKESALSIAMRSRGTARVANQIVQRVRDLGQHYNTSVSTELVNSACEMLRIDELGLTQLDRKILDCLLDNFDGEVVGLETLAASIGEDLNTIIDYAEPFLLRGQFITKTSKGRQITPFGAQHLINTL